MTNPARSVLLVTVTEPGLQEQQDAELAQKLADMKAAMTDEELDALIARTADFAAWTEENANSTMIDQMKAVSAQDLPEELTVYTAETKDADGVRMITSTADIGDLAAVGMVLDTSAVPADKLSELSFYATLLGSMPTENYTVEQLQTRAALLTNSISIDVGALELEGGGYAPMLTAQFVCMKDDIDEAMALVEEILTKTSLEDTDQMLMNATQAAFMPGYIAQNQPTQLANILLPAMTTKAGKYNYFVSFLQTDFEESLLAMDEDGGRRPRRTWTGLADCAERKQRLGLLHRRRRGADEGGAGRRRRSSPRSTTRNARPWTTWRWTPGCTAMSRWKCREACNTTIWFCRRRRRALLTAAKPM